LFNWSHFFLQLTCIRGWSCNFIISRDRDHVSLLKKSKGFQSIACFLIHNSFWCITKLNFLFHEFIIGALNNCNQETEKNSFDEKLVNNMSQPGNKYHKQGPESIISVGICDVTIIAVFFILKFKPNLIIWIRSSTGRHCPCMKEIFSEIIV